MDRLRPRNDACPAGENVQAWLYPAEEGHHERAWRKIAEENPFPAVMGRVCYHTCETACNRGKLDAWYYSDAPRTVRPVLDVARRQSGFAEVLGDLSQEHAAYEARRCMSCGNCFECDNCYGVCPDNAITKLCPGKRFEFKYDYCKGCGLCSAECPCGAIRMEPEAI